MPERIYRVSKLLYDLLKRHGKQLIVRNFFYEPLEMEYFKRGVERLPDDVIVMSKDTTHEFHPFYPWDPLHGQMGRKRQIIEIDLGVEKAWDTRGAYAQTDYIRRVVDRGARDEDGRPGRPRAAARRRALRGLARGEPVRLLALPGRSGPDGRPRAGATGPPAATRPRAVPHIVAALKRTEEINHRGRWHLEYWLHKAIGGEWGDYAYLYSRVLQRSRFKWTGAPADRELEDKLYHPDDETFRRAMAEKDAVVAQVRAAQADLRQAARYLPAAQLAPLEEDFRFLLDAAVLQREWLRAYFAQRLYIDQPSEAHRKTMEEASPPSSSASARPASPTASTPTPAAATTSTASCGRCGAAWPTGRPPCARTPASSSSRAWPPTSPTGSRGASLRAVPAGSRREPVRIRPLRQPRASGIRTRALSPGGHRAVTHRAL